MTIDVKILQQPDGTGTIVWSGVPIALAVPVEPVPAPIPEPVDPLPPVDPAPEPVDPNPEPIPEPLPVEPPPTEYAAFRVFGEDAVTWDHFNKVGNLWWANKGGDWIDANGVKQGDVPVSYAPVVVSGTPQWIALDVTPFVDRWLNEVNDGLFLRTVGGTFNCATRQHTDETLRPYLAVHTTDGQFACPCAGDVAMSDTTSKSQGDYDSMRVGPALVRFDLTGVTGEALSATAFWYSPKQYNNHALQAYFVDAPVPFDVGAQPIQGLAAAYLNDAGIEAHPDVITYWDWGPGWETNPGFTQVSMDKPFESVLIDGRHWLKVEMPVDAGCSGGGEGTGLAVRYGLGPVPASIDPIPQVATYPEEIYFRYSMRLGEDWTSVDDKQMTGGKFPGLSGRYGYPRPSQGAYYWQQTGANGGVPGQGKYRPVSQWDKYANFRGWSARTQWHAEAQGQHDNPMRACTPVGLYGYHPEWAVEGSGDVQMWPNVQLVAEREYDVEIHVRMNTVIGPFDEYGNSTVPPADQPHDGIYEAFVNGVRVFSKAWVWRVHPFLGVQEAWVLFKNGGTLSPCKPHTVLAGPAVVSRSYIGPRNLTKTAPVELGYDPAPEPVEPEPTPDPVEPTPEPVEPPSNGQDTALSIAARAVQPGQCVEFASPSLTAADSSGSAPFSAPPGSGGTDILDWASVMDLDPVTRRFYVSGGRPYAEPLAQKMIWYGAPEDKWGSRGNWSGASGGHIYRATCVAPELRSVFVMPYGSRLHRWDVDTDTYVGELPAPPSNIGGKTSGWSPVKCLMWHPGLGPQGSLVMANNSWDRVVRFDWATQAWSSVATFGEIWANQHFTGHYLPDADAVICGHSYAATPAPLALVYADGTYRLTAPAPCNVSCGGGDGGPFVPHPTRAASIAFCQATHRIWSYEHDTDEWIDRGPIPAEIDRLNIIGGTVDGVVFVAGNKTVHLYRPDF